MNGLFVRNFGKIFFRISPKVILPLHRYSTKSQNFNSKSNWRKIGFVCTGTALAGTWVYSTTDKSEQTEQTEAKWIDDLRKHRIKLHQIPKDCLTEDIIIAAIQNNIWKDSNGKKQKILTGNLYDFRFNKRICLEAFLYNKDELCYVPATYRNKEFFTAAAERNGLDYIKDCCISTYLSILLADAGPLLNTAQKEECMQIVKIGHGSRLRYIPKKYRTEEICKIAAGRYGALQYIPEELKTKEICLVAVSNSGKELQFVPMKLRTKEICLAAVNSHGYSINYVPDHLKTTEMYRAAVANNGYLLSYVPEELKSLVMYEAAVSSQGTVLKDVPRELVTQEMCEVAVRNTEFALRYVPDDMKTVEMYLHAVQRCAEILEYVPEKLRTAEMYVAAEAYKREIEASYYD